mgnify:CR=1 FL=1
MAYTKNTTWVDGEGFTLMTAAALNHIEDGIYNAAATADAAGGGGGGAANFGPVNDSTRWFVYRPGQTGSPVTVNNYTSVNLVPVVLTGAITLDAVSVSVTGAGGAGSNLRCGFYLRDGATMTRQGAEILIPDDSTGTKVVTFTPVSLPGTFWFGYGGPYNNSQPPAFDAVSQVAHGPTLFPTALTGASAFTNHITALTAASSGAAADATLTIDGAHSWSIPIFNFRSA